MVSPGVFSDPARLTTAQVAVRLRVKPETVYAYVSRGLLTAHRRKGSRTSMFDPLEVEALARRGGHGVVTAGSPGRPLPVLDSELTLLAADRLYYRGVDATELARRQPFEAVAVWLWTGMHSTSTAFPTDERLGRRISVALNGFDGPAIDRLRLAAVLTGAGDPERGRLDTDSVTRAGGRLLAAFPIAMHPGSADCCAGQPVAVRSWCGLTGSAPDPSLHRLLDALLVLCLDHDLAMSTLAVRAAASARSNPYAAVSAGLAAFDGPLHGGASIAAHRLLQSALRIGPRQAVAQLLHTGRRLPGFGHLVYREHDPRAELLLELAAEAEVLAPALGVAIELSELVGSALGTFANLDLALAVVSVGAGLPADTGQALFAVARSAGWLAHALEEYAAPPGRLRPGGRYVGPPARGSDQQT